MVFGVKIVGSTKMVAMLVEQNAQLIARKAIAFNAFGGAFEGSFVDQVRSPNKMMNSTEMIREE